MNSGLVDYVQLSPAHTPMSNKVISVITPHIAAAVISVEGLGGVAQTRGGAGNYGIGSDGRVGLYVEEHNSAHTSSNQNNDRKAVTIEVSNSDTGGDWPVSDTVLEKLIDLCEDVCRRNGIPQLNFTGDLDGNMTMHAWFADTGCPGHYLAGKFPYIANEVNRRLGNGFHSPDKPNRFDRGDAVQLRPGALYFNNHRAPDWLQGKLLYIRNVYGKYYDVSIYAESEGITGRVHEKYLVSLDEPEDETKAADVGQVIRLKEGTVYTTGKAVPRWVLESTLYLREKVGDNVIGFSVFPEGKGGITGYVDTKYVVLTAAPEPDLEAPESGAPEAQPEVPEKAVPGEAPAVPFQVIVNVVEVRDGFGRMEEGGWIPLNK